MARLTDTVCNRNKSRLLTPGGRHERRFPAQLEVEAGVGTADEQDEAKVARTYVQGADERGTADCTHDNGEDDVVVGFLEAAGCVRHTAREGIGDGIWRGLNEVGSELVEVECLHDLFSQG